MDTKDTKQSNAENLYTALHRLGRQLHRSAHRMGHREDFYREQSRLLLLIFESEGVIQRDLAVDMDVRPSSMTEMLAKMERLGFVRREQDETDQRVMHIYLTEKGKTAAEESKKSDSQLTEKLFEGLTAEETEEMLRLTEKLLDHLEALNSSAVENEPVHGHHRGFGGHRECDGCHHRGKTYHHEREGFGYGRFFE